MPSAAPEIALGSGGLRADQLPLSGMLVLSSPVPFGSFHLPEIKSPPTENYVGIGLLLLVCVCVFPVALKCTVCLDQIAALGST